MKPYPLYLFALGASALFPSLATAQSTAPDPAQSREEVIVRGQYLHSERVNALKTPTPILDVPQSLSIVTLEQMQRFPG